MQQEITNKKQTTKQNKNTILGNKEITETAIVSTRISSTGTKKWYLNGQLHRDDDLPAVAYKNGSECWYIRGTRHREYNKPAVILCNGNVKYEEYWNNGEFISGHIFIDDIHICDCDFSRVEN